MGYYTGKELEEDLTAACGDLDRAFNGGPYVSDFYLDQRSGLADCYIENEGIEPADPEDIKDVIRDNVGYILDIFETERGMGEYSFQIIVEYTPV